MQALALPEARDPRRRGARRAAGETKSASGHTQYRSGGNRSPVERRQAKIKPVMKKRTAHLRKADITMSDMHPEADVVAEKIDGSF